MYSPQYIILFHHFRELLKRANAAGIDMMPLKGAHLLTSVYPPKENRGTIADVDFLVRDKDWYAALALLVEYGFVPREHFTDESKRYEQGFYYGLPNGQKMLFEIHRHLIEPCRFPIDTQGVWQRAHRSDFEGVPCWRMGQEDLFCHVAWHSAIHRFMSHGRTLRDLELVLESPPLHLDALVEKIVERAKEWNIQRVVWLYLTLLTQSPPKMDPQSALTPFLFSPLAPPVHVQKMLLHLIGPTEHTRFSTLHQRVQAALIWPLIFDKKRHLLKMVANHPRIGTLTNPFTRRQ